MLTFKNETDKSIDLEIYDVVGFWGTNAKAFRERVKAAKGKRLNVHINSPGGSIFEGMAILNTLKGHTGGVTVFIDGIAASIASVIAMAGEEIIMPDTAMLMIHNPTVGADGEAEDLRKVADVLDKLKELIVNAYVGKTKADRKTVEKWMDSETWFTAEEAKDAGLVDTVVESSEVVKGARNQFAAYFPGNDIFKACGTVPAGQTVGEVPGGLNKNNSNESATDMKPEEIQALQNKVATLEAEKVSTAEAHASAIETAKTTATTEATNAAKNAEKTRKDAIMALRNKYGKDGDLDAITLEALNGDTTAEAFKDMVLDAVNERPTKGAIKPGAGQSSPAAGASDKVEVKTFTKEEDFRAAYEACEDDNKRLALVAANRNFARKLASE